MLPGSAPWQGQGPAHRHLPPPHPQVALLETNPYLLALTIIVSIVHSVFEFLAFKNGRGGTLGPMRGHGAKDGRVPGGGIGLPPPSAPPFPQVLPLPGVSQPFSKGLVNW